MNKENCALKLVDEIILYYDARSKKHKKNPPCAVYSVFEILYFNFEPSNTPCIGVKLGLVAGAQIKKNKN